MITRPADSSTMRVAASTNRQRTQAKQDPRKNQGGQSEEVVE
jgi:hypothetical protein